MTDLVVTADSVTKTLPATVRARLAVELADSGSEVGAAAAALIAAVIDAAPGALDTLNELAAALGDDPAFATTVTNALALKAPLASPALTGNPTAPTASPGDSDTSIATTAFVAAATPDSSTTVKGIVELATSAETITGSDAVRAVTPAGLAAKVASATASGIVELATDAETITGTDTTRALTPANLQAMTADTTRDGIVELATTAETTTGTDTVRAVTPAGLAGAFAGASYTPSTTNLTLGNGTITGSYFKIGKFVVFAIKFVLGSTSAIATAPTFSLPVTAASGNNGIWDVLFTDQGVGNFIGAATSSTTVIQPLAINTAGSFAPAAQVTSAQPFTWNGTNADELQINGIYLAA